MCSLVRKQHLQTWNDLAVGHREVKGSKDETKTLA